MIGLAAHSTAGLSAFFSPGLPPSAEASDHQGPAAPLGQLDFLINGAMIGGFALVAAPAEYKVTGIKTFMVSHDGIVFEKDLGPGTLKIFQQMDRYNPDKSWRSTDDEW